MDSTASPAPRGGASKDGAVVGLAELPDDHRALLVEYGRGGAAWDARREQLLGQPELARFLVDNLIVEMVKGYGAQASGAEELAFKSGADERAAKAFARAQRELVQLAPVSAPVLVELLGVKDGVVAQLCGDTLIEIGAPAALPLARALEQPSSAARRRTCEVAGKLGDLGPDGARIDAALMRLAHEDDDWTVRAQAADALGPRGAFELARRGDYGGDAGAWRAALEQCLRDEDAAVASHAARSLVLLGDRRAVSGLIGLLDSGVREGDLRRVRSAQAALVALTGARGCDTAQEWRRWQDEHPVQGGTR